jgi:mannan endo-1,4-beta-mannosidase
MKNGVLAGVVAILFFVSFPVAARGAQTADPLASSKAQAVLNYLTNLPNRTDNRVVAGQFEDDTSNFGNIFRTTGEYPGLLGRDYSWSSVTAVNTDAANQSNNGGLVSITNHFGNPATGGNAWDTSSVDLAQLITAGTTSNTNFKKELDKIATGFSDLQSKNVVVLFRPLHEMNGTWFWWGSKNAQQYKNLWIYVFNYLTKTKGLHNILWVYASNGSLDVTYYPGSQYVDIVGADIYGTGSSVPQVSGYSQLSTLGKPFAITEYGACEGGLTWSTSSCSPRDISSLIASIKQNMPKAVYWLAWNGVYAMDYNSGASTLLSDPWVVTRDEIVLPADGGNQAPAAPTGLRVVSQ